MNTKSKKITMLNCYKPHLIVETIKVRSKISQVSWEPVNSYHVTSLINRKPKRTVAASVRFIKRRSKALMDHTYMTFAPGGGCPKKNTDKWDKMS